MNLIRIKLPNLDPDRHRRCPAAECTKIELNLQETELAFISETDCSDGGSWSASRIRQKRTIYLQSLRWKDCQGEIRILLKSERIWEKIGLHEMDKFQSRLERM